MRASPEIASPAAGVAAQPRFPFFDLKAQFLSIKDELLQAVSEVLASQQYVLGPAVAEFERQMARYLECGHALSCASGTDAILLALKALGVGEGDEVILPAFTFVATASMVAWAGATPVFAEIDRSTFSLDAADVERRITPRTRAILPVHLFGLASGLAPLLEVGRAGGIPIVEDAAQAIGAQYGGKQAGTLGALGCFSFYPTKNLGAAGEGGLIVTDDAERARRIKLLRNQGSERRYEYEIVGANSRLDSLQAAILTVKLKYLHAWAEARRANARRYTELFSAARLAEQVRLPREPEGCHHVFNQYSVQVAERDALRSFLAERGLPTEIYYPYPLHLQPAFAYLNYREGSLPVSEGVARQVLSLPIYPELRPEHQELMVAGIADFFARRKG